MILLLLRPETTREDCGVSSNSLHLLLLQVAHALVGVLLRSGEFRQLVEFCEFSLTQMHMYLICRSTGKADFSTVELLVSSLNGI